MNKVFAQYDFFEEKKKNERVSLIVFLISLVVPFFLTDDFLMSLLVATFITLVCYSRLMFQNKDYIKSISISNSIIVLEYFRNGKLLKINAPISEVKIKKRFSFVKVGRVPFLVLKINTTRIAQYEIGEWTEQIMDDLKKKIEDLQL